MAHFRLQRLRIGQLIGCKIEGNKDYSLRLVGYPGQRVPANAIGFYAAVFGWQFTKSSG